MPAETQHSSIHRAAERHHGHTHAADSRHGGDHHLLQVENLTVSFRRYAENGAFGTVLNAPDEGDPAQTGLLGLLGRRGKERSNKHVPVGLGLRLRLGLPLQQREAEVDAPGEKVHSGPSRMHHRMHRQAGFRQREAEVLRGVNLAVHQGEVVAVVGASGAGKTLLADACLGMFDPHATVRGRIWFDGQPQTAESLAALRGEQVALVPQSVAALDPLMKVGTQVRGAARGKAERERRPARQRELFERHGLDEAVADLYPGQLSGGMARRVLLCCALMSDPQLIIADEPTVGLDLDLAVAALADLRAFADGGGGVMLITHDIELALRVADRVAVFHEGTVVEETAVANFAAPELLEHPFSRALWHALPEHGFRADGEELGSASFSRGSSGANQVDHARSGECAEPSPSSSQSLPEEGAAC